MKRRGMRIWLLLGLSGLLLCPVIGLAESCMPTAPGVFFGPKRYDKPSRDAVSFQEAVSLTVPLPAPLPPPELPPTYLIEVTTDARALSKGVVNVTLNGELIADTAALKNANPLTRSFTGLATNQLAISLQGTPTNYVTVRILCRNCAQVQVDSPLDDATVDTPSVTISGAIAGVYSSPLNPLPELVAEVHRVYPASFLAQASLVGGQFSVNGIPLAEGENRFCVAVRGLQGPVASSAHRLYYIPDRHVDLSASPDNGLAPFAATLAPGYVNVTPAANTVSCQGPAAVEVVPVDNNYAATFPEPGIYTCLLDVTDSEGSHYQDSVDITALSKAEMDARLVTKWSGMKDALVISDVEQAVSYFALGSRDVFRAQFNALINYLPQIGQDLQTIRLVEMSDDRAIYDLRKVQDGTEYSFQVEFVRDEDGIWRLRSF